MKILFCSVHFGPGHTAHLNAYQKMLNECGFEAALYIDKRYLKLFNDVKGKFFYTLQEALNFHPDVIWIWNTGFENIKVIKEFRKINARVVYVLHEPFMGYRELLKDGNYWYRQAGASLLNYWICSKSDRVILSSKYAEVNCQRYSHNAYKKSTLYPLLYPDEFIQKSERKYFSMIGGYSDAHGSIYFLNFIKDSYEKNDILFQIITRSDISEKLKDPILENMVQNGRLVIQQGRPLTEREMNEAYRSSICAWNGYVRSTQSGVLANSFMQGTPVMATHLGSFDEYVQDGKNGVFIDDFSYDSIFNAFQRVKGNMDEMVDNARNTFLTHFYYRNQEEKFKEIVEKLVK